MCVDMRCTACGGADSLNQPGVRGGLDARMGASLAPREDVSPGSHREGPQERTWAPVKCPSGPTGDTAKPRLDAGASLIRFGWGEAQAVGAATSSGKTRRSTSETP
jgi:hypothetical protein